MAEALSQDMNAKRQWRLIGMIFGGFVAILAIGYFLFLRLNYSLLYQDLPVSDASAIVAELETKEIKFRLRNGGRDILVPAVDADAIRLGILDSEAPRKKLDGFELFNDSEMGLTDFAQKIKYQRALQGELARTIMMIDGVENARVHIAIPERVLFRGSPSRPTAAVTIVTRSGQFDEETRISGIQRLVAASVPDLEIDQVSVLNSAGEIISPVETPVSSVLNEYAQIAAAYQEQIEIALAVDMPELIYDLKLVARPLRLLESNSQNAEKEDAEKTPMIQRNYTLRAALTTDAKLSDDNKTRIKTIVIEAAQLDIEAGDVMTFRQRDLPLNLSLATATQITTPPVIAQSNVTPVKDTIPAFLQPELTILNGIIGGAALAFIGFTGIMVGRRRRQILSTEEHIEFAQRLRLQLQETGEVSNGVS